MRGRIGNTKGDQMPKIRKPFEMSPAEATALLVTFQDYGSLDAAARKGTLDIINQVLIRLERAAKA